mmetsp:Transcript_12834/g.30554  ORF Transcript_12834/g.30554 Transcript_12834/m.30554 type:complete len:330 (+) Transcript_12834:475-1464(+)
MHLVATFTDSPTTESTIASLHVALHRYACESSFSVSSSFSFSISSALSCSSPFRLVLYLRKGAPSISSPFSTLTAPTSGDGCTSSCKRACFIAACACSNAFTALSFFMTFATCACCLASLLAGGAECRTCPPSDMKLRCCSCLAIARFGAAPRACTRASCGCEAARVIRTAAASASLMLWSTSACSSAASFGKVLSCSCRLAREEEVSMSFLMVAPYADSSSCACERYLSTASASAASVVLLRASAFILSACFLNIAAELSSFFTSPDTTSLALSSLTAECSRRAMWRGKAGGEGNDSTAARLPRCSACFSSCLLAAKTGVLLATTGCA